MDCPPSIAAFASARRRRVRYLSGLVPNAHRKLRAIVNRSVPAISSRVEAGVCSQRESGKGVADEFGRHVEDPIAEAVVGSCRAVVLLVGVQDVELTGQADTARAAVAERLHTGDCDADRIGVVPVRLERGRTEAYLCTLDPVRPRAEPHRLRPAGPARVGPAARAAGSFKTLGVDDS